MFVDGSALAAMLTCEDEARIFAARLQSARKRLTSPMAALSASLAVAATHGLSVEAAEAEVKRFLDLMTIQVVSLPAPLVPLAAEALTRYGALTTDDAFAYAAARYFRLPLLYKAACFAATDIEAA